VSRIDPRKGLRVLPDVVARLAERRLDVALDIVGPPVGAPGVAERQAIEARAAALGVGERLRFAGEIPLADLLGRYRDYDLFVLPTLPGEGIPRVLLEAMASGLPVVTTAVAGIPSLVVHEGNGLLVREPTAEAVSEAIARIVQDGDLRRRLIASGYDTARAHTLEIQAARMMREVASRLDVALRQPAAVPAA
jgi:glycosyltransferase involved in cell wall biosynthesis